jgi:hypothetical protein
MASTKKIDPKTLFRKHQSLAEKDGDIPVIIKAADHAIDAAYTVSEKIIHCVIPNQHPDITVSVFLYMFIQFFLVDTRSLLRWIYRTVCPLLQLNGWDGAEFVLHWTVSVLFFHHISQLLGGVRFNVIFITIAPLIVSCYDIISPEYHGCVMFSLILCIIRSIPRIEHHRPARFQSSRSMWVCAIVVFLLFWLDRYRLADLNHRLISSYKPHLLSPAETVYSDPVEMIISFCTRNNIDHKTERSVGTFDTSTDGMRGDSDMHYVVFHCYVSSLSVVVLGMVPALTRRLSGEISHCVRALFCMRVIYDISPLHLLTVEDTHRHTAHINQGGGVFYTGYNIAVNEFSRFLSLLWNIREIITLQIFRLTPRNGVNTVDISGYILSLALILFFTKSLVRSCQQRYVDFIVMPLITMVFISHTQKVLEFTFAPQQNNVASEFNRVTTDRLWRQVEPVG